MLGFGASLVATFACNGVELVSISDTPTFRGITIPLPPPAIIDEPIIRVDIEGQLGNEFGKQVVLADEKAMSERNSPYRCVGSLVDFILEKLSNGAS